MLEFAAEWRLFENPCRGITRRHRHDVHHAREEPIIFSTRHHSSHRYRASVASGVSGCMNLGTPKLQPLWAPSRTPVYHDCWIRRRRGETACLNMDSRTCRRTCIVFFKGRTMHIITHVASDDLKRHRLTDVVVGMVFRRRTRCSPSGHPTLFRFPPPLHLLAPKPSICQMV